MTFIKSHHTLDTSGTCCPMPIVETNKAIKGMKAGEVLEIVATDPGTKMDIPSWCQRTGNTLVEHKEDGQTLRYYVRKRN
ncbi:MAG: sulfurtransferase TusA family protein [Acidiferrobacter sp.]